MSDRTRSRKRDRYIFGGPTIEVARNLIGATLVRTLQATRKAAIRLSGRIVETEAYLPLVDPACHAFRGPTKRNASMFGRPGHAYIYFIYGNHFCLNVTTERPGVGGAVLIRALEPLEGVETMRRFRRGVPDERLLSGPGNLCRAMAIDRSLDGVDLTNDHRIQIIPPNSRYKKRHLNIITCSRVGLRRAADWPLRFYDASSSSVSKRAR